MDDNFNRLTPAQDERLSLLAEECAEVIVAVMKIQRHGYDRLNNRADLETECGHVNNALRLMVAAGDIDADRLQSAAYNKARKIGPYLHHQGPDDRRPDAANRPVACSCLFTDALRCAVGSNAVRCECVCHKTQPDV